MQDGLCYSIGAPAFRCHVGVTESSGSIASPEPGVRDGDGVGPQSVDIPSGIPEIPSFYAVVRLASRRQIKAGGGQDQEYLEYLIHAGTARYVHRNH